MYYGKTKRVKIDRFSKNTLNFNELVLTKIIVLHFCNKN